MSTLHLHRETTVTPEQFIAALTDFGPGRSEVFGNSAHDYLKIHDQSADHADVTEGSSGVWETLHYDWSDPSHVVLTTTDSNTWGGNSGFTYDLKPQSNGMTDVDVVVVREGKNFKGKMLGAVVGTVGKGRFEKDLDKTIKAIEARNSQSAGPSA